LNDSKEEQQQQHISPCNLGVAQKVERTIEPAYGPKAKETEPNIHGAMKRPINMKLVSMECRGLIIITTLISFVFVFVFYFFFFGFLPRLNVFALEHITHTPG